MSSRLKLRKRFQNFLRDPDQRQKEQEALERKMLQQERGIYKSETWANLVIGDYNPDKIDIATYKKMASYDAQVIAGLDILQMGVTGVPWRIIHPDEDIAEFLRWNFDHLRQPTFLESLKGIMTALPFGFSVTESVWEYERDQKRYVIRRKRGLKTYDPESIKFHTDAKGELLKINQSIGGVSIDLPLERTIVWSFNKQFGNWYGDSILKGCYKNWFIKDNMLKFANIAFERFGAPIMLGITKDIKSMDEVEETLKHLYARSVGVLIKRGEEDPTDIKVLESRRATMPFMEYIDYHNKQILMRMLVGEPILRGGGGVYGSRIPFEILKERFQEIRIGVGDALEDLLDLLVQLNFDTKEPAKIVFGPVETEKVEDRIEKELSNAPELEVR